MSRRRSVAGTKRPWTMGGPPKTDRPLPFRSVVGMKRIACPWCRADVFCDDAKLTAHHADPVCPGFARAVERSTTSGAVHTSTTVLDVTDATGEKGSSS